MYNTFPMMYPNMYQPQAQGMSPPTIHADIVQVSGEQEALNYPVAAGMTLLEVLRWIANDGAWYKLVPMLSALLNKEPEEGEVRGEVDTEIEGEESEVEAEGEAPKAEPENGNEE